MSILDPNPATSLTITVDDAWRRKQDRGIFLMVLFGGALVVVTIRFILGYAPDTAAFVQTALVFTLALMLTTLMTLQKRRANLRVHLQRALEAKLEYDDVKLNKEMTEFTATNTFGVEESEDMFIVTLTGRLVRINNQAYEVLFDK